MVCLQPQPEFQLVRARILRHRLEELHLGSGQGRVTVYSVDWFFVHLAHKSNRFVLQLISLAGLHLNAAAAAELAARYKTDGMLAYVELVQRKEKEIGCDVLTHQKWYVESCTLILVYVLLTTLRNVVQERCQLHRPYLDNCLCGLIKHLCDRQGLHGTFVLSATRRHRAILAYMTRLTTITTAVEFGFSPVATPAAGSITRGRTRST